MDRSKIRIVEFGDETSDGKRSPSGGTRAGESGIKVKEFGFGDESAPRRPAPIDRPAQIKIVEFDNESRPRETPPRYNAGGRAGNLPTPSRINIFEYDSDGRLIEKNKKEERRNGIKIIEF